MHVSCTCSTFCRANKQDRDNYQQHLEKCVKGYISGDRKKPCHFCNS